MPRRRAAVVTSLLLAPALTGCGIGFGAQTNQPYQPAVGDNASNEQVSVLSAVVFAPSSGEGTFSAALVNGSLSEDVTLTGITGDEVEVSLAAPVVIGPERLVDLTDTGNVFVAGDGIDPGGYASLVLEFDNGEALEMEVPVVGEESVFADIVPASPPEEASTEPSEPVESTAP
jgi:hypothetical protein